jgi:hypothetical protein
MAIDTRQLDGALIHHSDRSGQYPSEDSATSSLSFWPQSAISVIAGIISAVGAEADLIEGLS